MRTLIASWVVGWAGCWLLAGLLGASWCLAGWAAMFLACGWLLACQYQNLVRWGYAGCIENDD